MEICLFFFFTKTPLKHKETVLLKMKGWKMLNPICRISLALQNHSRPSSLPIPLLPPTLTSALCHGWWFICGLHQWASFALQLLMVSTGGGHTLELRQLADRKVRALFSQVPSWETQNGSICVLLSKATNLVRWPSTVFCGPGRLMNAKFFLLSKLRVLRTKPFGRNN